jgi:transcriptional regulator with XRE-family HTH domain
MAETLGEVVRELREGKNLTQAQLAERASVAVSYVVVLEAGRAGRTTSSILVRLAKALDVPTKRLADAEMQNWPFVSRPAGLGYGSGRKGPRPM